jgi:hypothetical protein
MVHAAGDTGWIAWTNAVDAAIALKAPSASPTFTGSVSGITAAMVGLGSVDNTADASKPVSTAQAAADTAAKARANHTGTQLAATISDFSTAVTALIPGASGVVAQATANVTPITTADVTLVTAPSITGDGVKRFKITGSFFRSYSTVGGDILTFKLKDNGTTIRSAGGSMIAGAFLNALNLVVTNVPTTGAHVYTMTAIRSSGTGTGTVEASAADPIEIIVERIA